MNKQAGALFIQNWYLEQVIKGIILEINLAIYRIFHSSYILNYFNPFAVCSYLYHHEISNIISNITSKKRSTNERLLSYLSKKGATNWVKKTMKEVFLFSKNLLSSSDIAESEENRIPSLPTADFVHIKPVDLGKDVQPSNLNFQ